nr:hypothetical protein [Corallococcus macrosporus]
MFLNGCGSADLQGVETASTLQGVAAAAVPLPVPGCPVGALDTDSDGICDLVEAVLGTNPNSSDTDGDRLSDYAEAFGFGGVLDLPTLGANARWTDFDVIKGKYFTASRAPYFHYMLFANRYSGGNSSGISRGIPAHDFVVTLGFIGGGTELQQAGTLMHELGHNIGLRHGGNDDSNYKPNYLSIMNYEYQFYGFGKGGLNNVLDYSRVQVAAFNEATVNEVSAFAPVAPTTEADLALISGLRFNNVQVTGNASANLDFDNNGTIQAASYALDFNRSGAANNVFPASQNDWTALLYDGGGQIGFAAQGLSQDLGREERFLVAPEKMEPCLTVDARDAR